MNVFFFGDSICFGQGISPHRGWVTRISADIERLAYKYSADITVINSSINGNTTRMALERMQYDIQNYGVDIIIIQFGMNDCNYWETDKGLPRVSPKAFEANLEEIIQRAEVFGAQRIFLNTNHPTTRYDQFRYIDIIYEESNKQYNNIIRKLGNSLPGVTLNDIEKYITDYLKTNHKAVKDIVLEDQLHLSLFGHELYYQFISPRILQTLEKMF